MRKGKAPPENEAHDVISYHRFISRCVDASGILSTIGR